MADGSACSSCPAEGSPPSSSGGTTTTTTTTTSAAEQHEATPIQSKLERRSSKSRLSKQEVVEVAEEMDLPHSEGQSLTGAGGSQSSSDPTEFRVEFRASEVVATIEESKLEAEEEEDHSPNSDSSDQTVVPAESLASSTATPHGSPKDNSPEDGGIPEVQKNSESDKTSPTQAVNPKVKLVRSQAVYDDASPPPEILIRSAAAAAASSSSSSSSIASPMMVVRDTKDRVSPIPLSGSQATLSVSPTFQMRGLGRPRLGQDSSQGSTVSDTSPALSRDSSFETSYTDSTGTNLEEFIIKTLNKKQSDRTMLLHLESDMIAFIKDTSQEKHKFPQMSSYHRMLVHRVAAFFGLDHNVDETGKSVIINRLECTRIPDFKFRDHIRDDLPQDDPPKKFILKRHRDCTSLEETLGTDRVAIDDRMSKSFEERQEEYHEARNRIFQQRDLMQEIGSHPTANRPNNLCGGSHQSSKDDVRWHPDLRPWNSTDSSGYSTDSSSRLKVYVTKASSFHSVTVLTRGDSRTSTGSSGSRFSKTDSLSSGISNLGSPIVIPPTIPSSPPLEDQEFESGSSDISAASPSQPKSLAVDPQTTGSPFLSFTDDTGEPLAIWVASTIDQIPPGSIIINPQTGEPYINADGTVYRWYPPSEWATPGDVEKVLRSGESPDNASSLSEPMAMVAHQDVDCCAAFHHQFSCMALRSPGGGESTMTPAELASPSPSTSHHHPPQHVYLFTPGGANPTPSLVAASTLQRPSLQPIYPVQPPPPPPPHKTSAPFYSTGGGGVGAPLHGVQPPHVRYVCQVGYQMPGPSDTPDPEQGATTPGHAGAPQYGCYPSSSGDVCQVMAFPPHQMTIHSVETYPPPSSAPPHHLPPDQHGYMPQPPPPPPQPQMVPCMYVPQYSSETAVARKVPNQQILYVPAGSYAVDSSGAPVQSAPNQGQVQVIRVNAATSPNGSSQVYYSGQPQHPHHQQQQQPGGGGGGGGSAPQYVCYTYPLAEAGHACSASMPLVPSYPMAPAIVRPGFAYPGGAPKLQSSSSPKSSQQGYQRVARVSQGGAEAPTTERARETSGGFLPRQQHLPGPRMMSVRQPQVVYPNRPPASFALGDCRLPMPNVLPVFPNIVRPRTRVPDVNLCESIDVSLSAYQSVAAATNVIEGNNSNRDNESSANKGQQRLA